MKAAKNLWWTAVMVVGVITIVLFVYHKAVLHR